MKILLTAIWLILFGTIATVAKRNHDTYFYWLFACATVYEFVVLYGQIRGGSGQ